MITMIVLYHQFDQLKPDINTYAWWPIIINMNKNHS